MLAVSDGSLLGANSSILLSLKCDAVMAACDYLSTAVGAFDPGPILIA
jgi:hypothetical protein